MTTSGKNITDVTAPLIPAWTSPTTRTNSKYALYDEFWSEDCIFHTQSCSEHEILHEIDSMLDEMCDYSFRDKEEILKEEAYRNELHHYENPSPCVRHCVPKRMPLHEYKDDIQHPSYLNTLNSCVPTSVRSPKPTCSYLQTAHADHSCRLQMPSSSQPTHQTSI